MFDQFVQYIPHLIFTVIVAWILYLAHKNATHNFNIFDYFMDENTGKPSVTRPLQMLGGLTATWIVVKMTVNQTLTAEIFAIYLAAVGLMSGVSKYFGAKTSKEDKDAK